MKLFITLSALVAACSAGIYLPHGAGYGAAPYPSHYGYATDDFPIAPVHIAAPVQVAARFAVRPQPIIAKVHAAPIAAVHAAPIAVAAGHAAPIAVATVRAAPIAVAAVRAAPIAAVHAAPVAAVAGAVSSQFHSQDEAGNFAFGYQNENSARQESGNIHTGLAGSYTDGRLTTNYVADNYGFRITN